MEPTIKKVLVPIDFSDYSKSAFNYAVNFSKIFKAELVLVYVIEPIIYPADFSMGQIAIPAVTREWDVRAKEELVKLANSEITKGVKVSTVIKTGKPSVEIIETALEENVDIIIIATHGHTGVEHILFGSTAEKVVRKAHCAVLTLREPLKEFLNKDDVKKEED
jgi:nucleotide-binding universal stress UspA family protein